MSAGVVLLIAVVIAIAFQIWTRYSARRSPHIPLTPVAPTTISDTTDFVRAGLEWWYGSNRES